MIHDQAGEQIVDRLAIDAEHRLADDGILAKVYLFKNNTDSAGSSYGCHENYLGRTRHFDFTGDPGAGSVPGHPAVACAGRAS